MKTELGERGATGVARCEELQIRYSTGPFNRARVTFTRMRAARGNAGDQSVSTRRLLDL
jgi:hypothetical protein